MSEKTNGIKKRVRAKLSSVIGMTLAEVLMVVGIIAVLAGVGTIAVWNYQRSLGLLERDGIAKEIFIAAQNHLTAMKGQGYLGEDDYGTPGTYTTAPDNDPEKKVYYYVVSQGEAQDDAEEIFQLMLPFGSIDESVRRGGSYLVRYQPETATVLDVFYWTEGTSPTQSELASRTQYNFTGEPNYKDFLEKREQRAQRRTYLGGSILGWYGGADAEDLPKIELKAPTIQVKNEDTLTVTVTDPNTTGEDYTLMLIVTGDLSGAQTAVPLWQNNAPVTGDGRLSASGKTYTYVLDDITQANKHFAELPTGNGKPFIPGENLKIQAVAYSTKALANIAYSPERTTNSLYADGTTTDTAYIANMRHLENLDKKLSKQDANDSGNQLNIAEAKQLTDLSWTPWSEKQIYHSDIDTAQTDTGCYYPVSPDYTLSYDGQNHSITGVKAEGLNATNAGLFGETGKDSMDQPLLKEVRDLELIDFSITGTESAGALAGTLTGTNVTNVLARNTGSGLETNVTTKSVSGSNTGIAGGLIGVLDGGSVQYSAAALIVGSGTDAPATAGGLIGRANAAIVDCFAGGHTVNGAYPTDSYNVTGGVAGGLVGKAGSSAIGSSYSTCSVSGTGHAGGLVGTANGGAIDNSYCTGLVRDGSAFLGSGNPSFTGNNRYYEMVNMTFDETHGTTVYLPSGAAEGTANAPQPFDRNVNTFNAFVGDWDGWKDAKPYDSTLRSSYSGRYTLRTVEELNPALPEGYSSWDDLLVADHYGDWPSPETFIVNTQ
jgi:type II secretory pathway pseudopilin PulG